MKPSAIFPLLEGAILACATHILDLVDGNDQLRSWSKPDSSLVTTLDLECEEIILSALKAHIPVLSEETVTSHRLLSSLDPYVVCDPIDGTTTCKRFLRELGGQVGFGPLLGYVEGGILRGAVFYHVNRRTLISAWSGQGVRAWRGDPRLETITPFDTRPILLRQLFPTKLNECVMLFYLGRRGEAPYIEHLKTKGVIYNCYRFGGFANDAARIAWGFEDIQLQFSVKPWDLAATLFPLEAGYDVIVDPLDKAQQLPRWTISWENPVIVCPPDHTAQLLKVLGKVKESSRPF